MNIYPPPLQGFGRRKPPPWAALDGRASILARLKYLWLFNEGGGSPRDRIARSPATLSGDATWNPGESAPAVRQSATTSYIDTNLTVDNFNHPAGTIWWRGYLNGSAAADGVQRDLWGNQASAADILSATKFLDSNWYVGWYTGAVDYRVTFAASDANFPQNRWVNYFFCWDASGSYFYLDGNLLGTNGTAPNTAQTPAGTMAVMNTENFVGGAATGLADGSKTDIWAFWSRRLSVPEIYALVLKPFYYFVQPASTRAAFAVAAAAGGFRAAWAQRGVVIGGGTH